MKTTQSLIKDIMPEDFCPHYIHLKYVEGLRTEPTKAMQCGLLFESELLGSARGGKYEMPKLKSGKPSADEIAVLNNVSYAKNIFDKIGVKILKVQPFVELDDRSGHLDAIAELYGKRVILDVKWTGMSNEQYKRELRYGTMESYLTQARHYQSIIATDFYFLVFGKSNWCEIIYIPYDEQAVAEHVNEYSDVATAKFENLDNYEFNATFDKCNQCRLKDLCKKKVEKPEPKHYESYVQQY